MSRPPVNDQMLCQWCHRPIELSDCGKPCPGLRAGTAPTIVTRQMAWRARVEERPRPIACHTSLVAIHARRVLCPRQVKVPDAMRDRDGWTCGICEYALDDAPPAHPDPKSVTVDPRHPRLEGWFRRPAKPSTGASDLQHEKKRWRVVASATYARPGCGGKSAAPTRRARSSLPKTRARNRPSMSRGGGFHQSRVRNGRDLPTRRARRLAGSWPASANSWTLMNTAWRSTMIARLNQHCRPTVAELCMSTIPAAWRALPEHAPRWK